MTILIPDVDYEPDRCSVKHNVHKMSKIFAVVDRAGHRFRARARATDRRVLDRLLDRDC